MADRFDVVAVRIKDEGPVVARVVVGPKSGTTVVTPARRHGRLVKGVNGGAVVGGEGDVEGLACLALAYPEVRLAPPPEPRCRGTGFHDQLVAKRGEGLREEALAPLELRDRYTYVIQHRSHLLRPQADRTDIR